MFSNGNGEETVLEKVKSMWQVTVSELYVPMSIH